MQSTAECRADAAEQCRQLLPAAGTVSLRPIEVERYDLARVIVSQGLVPGDVVVTAGVQALRPGQKVRLLGAAS